MKKDRKGLIIAAIALGLLMSSLDNTITSSAISHIIKDINGFDQFSWVFTAYMLASTSMMLVFGKMSDLFGRKLFYLIGIGFFLLGSALCGMAQDMTQLILFRAVQGIGAGALFPISFTIIFTMFADPKQAAKMSGVLAGVFGLSSVAGPQLGTFLSEQWGWRWCFYVNLPIGILSSLILMLALKESRSERRPSIDYMGTVCLIITTISLMLALELGGKDFAWGSWQIILLFAASILCGTLLLFVERRAKEPILPLPLFRNRMIVGMTLGCICQGGIMFSAISYLPIFSTAVLGNANSNTLLTPMMFSLMVGAIAFGFLQQILSYRLMLALSMTGGIVVSVLLATVSHHASTWYMVGLMIALGLIVIGPLMSVAQNAVAMSVDRKYIGISSSFVGFWRNIGGVLGASIIATIVNNDYKHIVQEGAVSNGIPADQVSKWTNPDLIIQAGAGIPKQILGFVRDSLGSAINHGFILCIIFGAIGIAAALIAGPGRYVRPSQPVEQATAGHM
ncbi:MFS transporter [Paenibacillus oenotherae]|uniref:MFS transporter n=2 Tax=Paenibacillus oenotherae TaxID=1435645 RepID=A0ABS7D5D6_9BACL|nr:MFS transporter [Paenibacillus oenotherae]